MSNPPSRQPGTGSERGSGTSRGLRIAGAFVLVVALLLPLTVLFWQFWSSTGEDKAFTNKEQAGMTYLRPLYRLLGTLDEAQAAAVRGQPVAAADVRAALAAVDDADRAVGGSLGTQQRWAELRSRIEGTVDQVFPAGAAAYQGYAEPTELTLGLITKLSEQSNLVLDPQLDSYYLMDTALTRLPRLIVDAGRAADLAALSPAEPGRPGAGGNPAADATRFAIARDRVATGTSAIDSALRTSVDANAALGPKLLAALDEFRASANAIAPSTVLVDTAVARADSAAIQSARGELRKDALTLGATALTELDGLLGARAARIDGQRLLALAAIGLGALVTGLILFLRLPEREPVRSERLAGAEPAEESADEPLPDAADTGAEDFDLVDARELLASAELVHVGRALRPRRADQLRSDRDDEPR